ncbi:Ti-type conjugative transfer relaxase TraA [Rhizobium sp. SSA_523]|uniref:Ti-type conjugative transfer relaxase TraA n=1 Tax=Rhizobium sp. SSA_523 TaxID=2952477 RepID=UPI002090EC40|nr:Ti-type conjugative transfer relaxase TraA [Rhizobium sp. SSA_523]MCO5734775.1 Ti-type conjugative transfer relaxase TraA [Rhizobium sp. SSA_523]WKC21105.1 Ti-type conjugative transfer relaxase TraA [Rhizobium sp. SSA_523]
MAIFYCQMSVVSRTTGRSAVAAAAYRAAKLLTNQRDGLVHDYSRREGVGHSEVLLPEGVDADWARDRSALWNAAERIENRKDARVAREFVIALPHELSEEGRVSLTRAFAQDLANRYGAGVDFAIHRPGIQGDVRNHHAHVLMTTRQVTGEGLGAKTYIELANKDLLPKGLPPTQMQLVDIRRSWEGMANDHLAREGFDIRIDHRSHAERGLEIEPTEHMGVGATNLRRRGGLVDRSRLAGDAGQRNADVIREKPEQVLSIITSEKSVFDRHDIARTLHRYINDDAQAFQNGFASVMASSALTELRPERVDEATGEVELARYSTREMVEIEHGMADAAERLHQAHNHYVDRRHVVKAMEEMDEAIRLKTGNGELRLSDEQRHAISHVTGPERIAAVVGLAGAGKSTMLAAAAQAWERQGYTVHGAALSGKAAEGLEESSGIKSRTLASWSRSWENEKHQLGRGDVFVIDEAGMVGSRQLASFVSEAEKCGAKIVLVGDHEQLQAIGAGAPFRAISERIGHASLGEIKRQQEPWQQEASVAFASHRAAEGLAAYRDKGNIHFASGRDEARAAVVRDYLADRDLHPEASRVAMAHRRVDVRAINEGIRAELQERGELAKGEEAGEFSFQTNDGVRSFAPGDRLVFLENSRDLGVKNGMLGDVKAVEQDAIYVALDGASGRAADARMVRVPMNDYRSVDHGYATTIHKNQGATVDQAFVLASGTMDRHLTYVAMSRHRHDVQLYADAQEFASRRSDQVVTQGKLVEHGAAPYEHKAGNRDSYFVTLETAKGERHTVWGVGLQQAIAEASPEMGATIGLQHTGAEAVRLPNGHEASRNGWKVLGTDELAYAQLEHRLSRSGVKETTLDYARDFAERRGIAQQFGVSSEIEVRLTEPAGRPGQNETQTANVGHTSCSSTGADRSVLRDEQSQASGFEIRTPLVPAKIHHDRSVEDVARQKTMATFGPSWNGVERIVRQVFRDPQEASSKILASLVERDGDSAGIEQALNRRPEQFGELRGKTGILGDNKERIEARQSASIIAKHVGAAGEQWQRRVVQEERSERWQRENRDCIEVPNLSPRSASLIAGVRDVETSDPHRWINSLSATKDGRAALEEAKKVWSAISNRFGSEDLGEIATRVKEDPGLAQHAETIRSVVSLVRNTTAAEVQRDWSTQGAMQKAKDNGLER